jgi:putative transposase
MSNPRIFRYFKTSPEIIRLAVMMYVRYPLPLRNVEELLHECGIDKSSTPPATTGPFNPTALQADCLGFCPGTVAQLLEVVLVPRCRLNFAD